MSSKEAMDAYRSSLLVIAIVNFEKGEVKKPNIQNIGIVACATKRQIKEEF